MLEIGSYVDNKYKILNKIGQGGMSVVYLAMNERANKQWAIKEVRKDGVKNFEVVRQGLVVETDLLKKLNHPNLPSIVDVIDEEDTFLIVMDYIEGNTLSKILDEYGAQSQEDVIKWAKTLCDVLGYLHTRRPPIIYRDLKPSNIMLRPDGSVVLIDFGTAREYKAQNLADTTCLGTIGYAAPEQFGGQGQTDARTDIYNLGATLYHLVTGHNPSEPPYEMKPIRQINPNLSSGLEKIILKCVQANPDDRYQSAQELMFDLENYEKIDDAYIRGERKKFHIFSATALMTFISLLVTIVSFVNYKGKKNENYASILLQAKSEEDYYRAIAMNPENKEAYEGLLDYLTNDGVLDEKDTNYLNQLKIGLDIKDINNGDSIKVLEKFKDGNKKDYEEFNYKTGKAFLYYSNSKSLNDIYAQSATWLKEAGEGYTDTDLYLGISNCLDKIRGYKLSRVPQTVKLSEEYGRLWKKIEELNKDALAIDDLDSKVNTWNLLQMMINHNASELTQHIGSEKLLALLKDIKKESESINEENINSSIEIMNKNLDIAVEKIESIRKE